MNINKVKGLMAECNVTRKELAKYLGISEFTLRKRLAGKVDFTSSEIVKLAKKFNVSPSLFFTPSPNQIGYN